ncbi:MAG: hypothetical protein BWY91_01797 [bacterium ADurb.BinA028]|nr:MAG: hypothetical protein BWY91_01797 [bacterium ADurb.BinA028]
MRPPDLLTNSAVAGPTVPSSARAKVAVGASIAWPGIAAPPGIAWTAAVLPAIRGSSIRRVMAGTNCAGPEAATVFAYAVASVPMSVAKAVAEICAWSALIRPLSMPTR